MRPGARALILGAAVAIPALSLPDARVLMHDFGPPGVDFRLEQRPVAPPTGTATAQPYYHDGGATTLRAVLLEKGTVHGVGETSSLDSRQVSDRVAYLKTL